MFGVELLNMGYFRMFFVFIIEEGIFGDVEGLLFVGGDF